MLLISKKFGAAVEICGRGYICAASALLIHGVVRVRSMTSHTK